MSTYHKHNAHLSLRVIVLGHVSTVTIPTQGFEFANTASLNEVVLNVSAMNRNIHQEMIVVNGDLYARLKGVEPPTPSSEAKCSIH